jgi:hypothetical protein
LCTPSPQTSHPTPVPGFLIACTQCKFISYRDNFGLNAEGKQKLYILVFSKHFIARKFPLIFIEDTAMTFLNLKKKNPRY